MKKRWLVWIPATVLAGLVAVGSGFRFVVFGNRSPYINRVVNEERGNFTIPENYLELLNSNEVIIKNIAFKPDGFVIVREEISGNPSEIVGVSELVKGREKPFVIIALSKEIKSGDIIYVNYYIDDGDGEFDPELDIKKDKLLGQNSYIKLIVVGTKQKDPLEANL